MVCNLVLNNRTILNMLAGDNIVSKLLARYSLVGNSIRCNTISFYRFSLSYLGTIATHVHHEFPCRRIIHELI